MSAVTKIKKSGTTYDINDSRISTSGSTNGQVLTANGSGGMSFADPSVGSSNISSGSATNGQVLTANGSGGVSWEDASGGGTIYQHFIYQQATYGGKYLAGIMILSTSNTPITAASDIANWLYTKGFNSYDIGYPAYGNFRTASDNHCVVKTWYSSDGTTLTLKYEYVSSAPETKDATFTGTFTDIVLPIA